MSDVLFEVATPKQREYLEAVDREGSYRAAARALGVDESSVRKAANQAKARAAKLGWAPEHDHTRTVPDGYKLRGVSSYYNKDGELAGQWVKTQEDRERQFEIMRAAIEGLCEEAPRLPPVEPPAHANEKLLNNFVITDYHVGMLAWHREGGADWDLNIAEQTLLKCFSALIGGAPPARKAVVCQMGDFLHTDGLIPTTPTSGHILDTDGRFEKIVEVAVRSLRAIVDMALRTHEEVHVIMAEGNHDIASSVWLRCLFGAMYENEPRVTIDRSALPYYAVEFGKVMLGVHHGHLAKIDKFPGLFAAQFPEIWGRTKHRYGHSGHWHHEKTRQSNEQHGMTVKQHRTLAAKDAYAARGGYFAERKAECETYHADHGVVGSNHVTPEMVD